MIPRLAHALSRAQFLRQRQLYRRRHQRIARADHALDPSRAIRRDFTVIKRVIKISRRAFRRVAQVVVVSRHEHDPSHRVSLRHAHRAHRTARVSDDDRVRVAPQLVFAVWDPNMSTAHVRVWHRGRRQANVVGDAAVDEGALEPGVVIAGTRGGASRAGEDDDVHGGAGVRRR